MLNIAGLFGALAGAGGKALSTGEANDGMKIGGRDAEELSIGGEIHNLGNSMMKSRLGQMNAIRSAYGMPDLQQDGAANYASNMARKNEALAMQKEADDSRLAGNERFNAQTDYLKQLTAQLEQSKNMQATELEQLFGGGQ